MYRVLSLSLVAVALALFSSTPTWAQAPGSRTNPAGVNPANPANQGRAMEGKFVETEGANKFIMTDQTGLHQHAHTLAADAKVMCDGRACNLRDLKKGTLIRVWTEPNNKNIATKIEATTKDRFESRPGSDLNRR